MSRNAEVRRATASAVAAVAALLATGCSSQTIYASGQAWQRNECMKIQDAEQRQRCLRSTATSFEDYQRQAEAAKGR